jgi:hypothetical protein
VTVADARRYLVRITVLHVSTVLLFVGMLLGVLDLSTLGVLLMVLGLGTFAWAVLSTWVEAIRKRSTAQPWFGTGSVAADANRLSSWWYVPEACGLLGVDEERVRKVLARLAAASVVTFVAVPVAAIAVN